MAGIKNDVFFGSNVDFTGNAFVSPQITADGQLLIGSSVAPNIRAGSLTSLDASIAITVGNGTINLSAVSTGITWSTVTSNTTMAVNNGYVTNSSSGIVFTLPSVAPVGSTVQIAGFGVGGWQIAQTGSQAIIVGSSQSTPGPSGSIYSSNKTDTITLTCIVANLIWTYTAGAGNYNIV